MDKTRRNDPCPCGSGKKYKRCCQLKDESNANESSVNNELYRIHQDLISTVQNKYNALLQEQFDLHESSLIHDSETKEIYHTGLTPWVMLFKENFPNNESILERYCRHEQKRMSPRVQQIVSNWLKKAPSVYEIMSIDAPKKQFLHVQDLKTEERFFVPFQDAEDYIEGSLLIGTLVPFVHHDNFLFTLIKLFSRDKQFYINLLNQYDEKEGGLEKHYPEFLAEALSSGLTLSEWKQPRHEEVANIFAHHMSERNMNDRVIMDGIAQWNMYCQQVNPTIQKAEPYAAALDYYVQVVRLNNDRVRQGEVAEAYGSSASAISRIYRLLLNELN